MRPGFLVQRAYDADNEKVYSIGAPELQRECPDLAKEVRWDAKVALPGSLATFRWPILD